MTTEDVLMEYRKCLSIRETARELDISEGAVRKCLITHGEIETAMTRRIGALLQEGRSQKEICGMLGISSSCVNANSPYERGMQIEPSQTAFQSTHPVPSLWRSTTPYFNPRTPHGVRLGAGFVLKNLAHISIHAPLTGCDNVLHGLGLLFDISIHAPLTGCDHIVAVVFVLDLISIHTPLTGCDLPKRA